ncbi:MAG: GTPase Era [Proteobacteria bacterium]|nr:GTPase Era [Pseudomonadota bacterium]
MNGHRCGIAAVVGRPNVGKSTLINTILGRKVSIVTAKPQTTRHRILAVHTADDVQVVFVDTPGLHRQAGKAMNRLMNRTAANALADADVVLFVSDATRWTNEDDDVLSRLEKSNAPVVAVLNKIDAVRPREKLLESIARISAGFDFAEIVPLSALKGDNLDTLMGILPDFLPESPPLFPDDVYTDRSREFHAAELIREKLTAMLHQELPYGLTVQVERYLEDDDAVTINAIVWVERDSQKGIVVGKNGSVLKRVGRAARLELKEQLGRSVHLELWVKLRSNWADNEQDLMSLGYEAS